MVQDQTYGMRQGCLLSLTLFNIFLEMIMNEVLEEFEGTVRPIFNLRFTDDIDLIAGNETLLKRVRGKVR